MAAYGKDSKRHLYKWVDSTPVNKTLISVLRAITYFADPNGETYRGQSALAQRLRCSTKTVERALKKLERDGFITRRRRYNARGHRTSDIIRLCWDKSLTDTLSDGDQPNRQPVLAYPTNSPSLPDKESEESYPESTMNLPPNPHRKTLLRVKRFDVAWDSWVAHYKQQGAPDKILEAESSGYFSEYSKWPPKQDEAPTNSKSFDQPPSASQTVEFKARAAR